ncbi:putative atp-dependent dna helicase [Erysiphe necator]|uniref:DNA 3'-5' helicase n=1 Tax=Uncinula necator TaxID=52586 RepID=A0A0B1P3Q1_UNCNE|nr:putative atp-dependent dna helicase [Erysiphe necator]
MLNESILNTLNESQKSAVTSNPHGQLSILAGPGSGKTHTLVARTAWLLSNGTKPWDIIVTTFTVKTAREIKERIGKLVGESNSSRLILGTFHSIARRYLIKYGYLINLKNEFDIADSADCLAIIKRIINRHELKCDPKTVRNRISGTKARGGNRDQNELKKSPISIESQEFFLCYREYEEALNRSNLLDYDDLLLNCVKLLREHPICVANIEAVLIDEFQDTNTVQYELMRLFASCKQQVTIVGDPDQSIYSFRAAELQNYQRFHYQYPKSTTIILEDNYRSSGAIISMALNIIKQDSDRITKSLISKNTFGTRPVIRKLSDAHKEAEWISLEIKRIVGMTGGLLDLGDVSILLRSAALSRLIENSLRRTGLAYRMVGGVRFYDRFEVKILLDYLRAINKPDNDDALSNILNGPPRKIGDTTIRRLMEEATNRKITLWSLLLMIVKKKIPPNIKLSTQVMQGILCVCDLIETSRDNILNHDNPISLLDLMKRILKHTKFEEWLQIHHNDALKLRWSNVEELMTQVMEFQENNVHGYEDESLPLIDGVQQKGNLNVLAKFLANVALSSGTENNAGGISQITISTIHAAKGLEWPVVFIPAVYQGSIPHSRSDDSKEERRLLYVAMTRAKVLLYLSYPLKSSRGEKTALSEFVPLSSLAPDIITIGPVIHSEVVKTISQTLHRPNPNIEVIMNSSSLLPSEFDNMFPANVENHQDETEMLSHTTDGNKDFQMDYQSLKRRHTRSDGMENHHRKNLNSFIKADHIPSFKTSFISAGSHLETMLGKKLDKLDDKKMQSTKVGLQKDVIDLSNHKTKLAKAEHQQRSLKSYFSKAHSGMKVASADFTLKRPGDNLESNMQLSCTKSSIQIPLENQPLAEPENEVCHKNISLPGSFLVSSKPKELTRNNLVKTRKTLGVKRSMAGWPSRKEFVLPIANKENHSN